MTYTDIQLKQTLAKMLPEKVRWKTFHDEAEPYGYLFWKVNPNSGAKVLDTELLHLCWLVEESLTADEVAHYMREIQFECDSPASDMWFPKCVHATWQQRTIALAKVKGIEIV